MVASRDTSDVDRHRVGVLAAYSRDPMETPDATVA